MAPAGAGALRRISLDVTARSRLDQTLVQRGLVASRSRARALILAGEVRVDGQRVDKPGTLIQPEASIQLTERPRFASRGGDKLAPVLRQAGIDPTGRRCIDIGASTGGFTDCLLQHGAAGVIAVDVGYGQLDWRLRQDPRVTVRERTNARYLQPEHLPDAERLPDLAVMDVSFIGAGKLLPALGRVCSESCDALVLVKPQFEAGPKSVERGGVVRDARVRRQAVESVADAAEALGWRVVAAYPSPLRGPAGNWECFLHLARGAASADRPCQPLAGLHVPDDSTGGNR